MAKLKLTSRKFRDHIDGRKDRIRSQINAQIPDAALFSVLFVYELIRVRELVRSVAGRSRLPASSYFDDAHHRFLLKFEPFISYNGAPPMPPSKEEVAALRAMLPTKDVLQMEALRAILDPINVIIDNRLYDVDKYDEFKRIWNELRSTLAFDKDEAKAAKKAQKPAYFQKLLRKTAKQWRTVLWKSGKGSAPFPPDDELRSKFQIIVCRGLLYTTFRVGYMMPPCPKKGQPERLTEYFARVFQRSDFFASADRRLRACGISGSRWEVLLQSQWHRTSFWHTGRNEDSDGENSWAEDSEDEDSNPTWFP